MSEQHVKSEYERGYSVGYQSGRDSRAGEIVALRRRVRRLEGRKTEPAVPVSELVALASRWEDMSGMRLSKWSAESLRDLVAKHTPTPEAPERCRWAITPMAKDWPREVGEWVLVFRPIMRTAERGCPYPDNGKWWIDGVGEVLWDAVTHWRPLPSPPETP